MQASKFSDLEILPMAVIAEKNSLLSLRTLTTSILPGLIVIHVIKKLSIILLKQKLIIIIM
jgi:hypothetical protein